MRKSKSPFIFPTEVRTLGTTPQSGDGRQIIARVTRPTKRNGMHRLEVFIGEESDRERPERELIASTLENVAQQSEVPIFRLELVSPDGTWLKCLCEDDKQLILPGNGPSSLSCFEFSPRRDGLIVNIMLLTLVEQEFSVSLQAEFERLSA